MGAACDFLCDPANRAVVDLTWTRAAAAQGLTAIRAPLLADAAGHVDWNLALSGVRAWKAAGVQQDLVCAYEYLPPFTDTVGTQYPNTPVGTGTHRLTTRYVERFRLLLEAHLPALLAADPDLGIIAGNEPQVNLVLPGDNCPPGTRLKRDHDGNPLDSGGNVVPWEQAERIPDPRLNRSSVSSTAYAALVWQACHSLAHVGCTRRIAGAYSLLPQSGLDAKNPYVLGHLGAVYAHLAACGVRPNWTHLALNMEGYWIVEQAQKVHDRLIAFMRAHGDTAELLVTEWGVRNHGADVAQLLETGRALTTVFGAPRYFCRPGLVPNLGNPADYTDYGLFQWRAARGRYVLGAPYALGDSVPQLWRV